MASEGVRAAAAAGGGVGRRAGCSGGVGRRAGGGVARRPRRPARGQRPGDACATEAAAAAGGAREGRGRLDLRERRCDARAAAAAACGLTAGGGGGGLADDGPGYEYCFLKCIDECNQTFDAYDVSY
uniref:Uncharacterized protein n=1 Tax=Oryza sativa subsp. japonica TaxID=39947 RepID=Q2R0H7_ORYSJ|nr:hypothetical protein LOC_Os11g42520 [Oryza sativa Japonica Group]